MYRHFLQIQMDFGQKSIILTPVIYFLSAAHGIILALLVAFHKRVGRPLANRLLGLTILFFSLCLAEYGTYTSGYFQQFPHIIASTNVLLFSIPPLLYMYIKSRVKGNIDRADYLWFTLPFIYLISGLPFYTLSAPMKLEAVSSPNSYLIFSEYWAFIYLMVCIFFSVISLKLISRNGTANRNRNEMQWLFRIILVYLVFSIVDVGLYFIGNYIPEIRTITRYSTTTLQAILIYALGYLAILNPKILFDLRFGKYEKSTLSESAVEHLLSKILNYMEEHKPYLNSELRMGQLASELSLTTNQISQVLNQSLNKNFYEFINDYRVQEVKKRLKDPQNQNYTIYGIAMDSGFNSKNAFNRTFKKHTGKTPSEFLKNGVSKELT